EGAKIKSATAFDDFCRAIDENDLFGQFLRLTVLHGIGHFRSGPTPARAEGTTWWALLGAFGFVAVIRFGWFRHNIVLHETLRFKARVSGGIGQGFDFSVITRAAPIENDLSDAFAKSGLGGQSAESFCAGSIGCELLTVGSGFAGGRSRCERYAGGVINK